MDIIANNPFVFLCLVGLCWPGPIPLVIVLALAQHYDIRNPFIPKGAEVEI